VTPLALSKGLVAQGSIVFREATVDIFDVSKLDRKVVKKHPRKVLC
jgi:hypothetical protein